jgi:hypothetical protein
MMYNSRGAGLMPGQRLFFVSGWYVMAERARENSGFVLKTFPTDRAIVLYQ